MKKITALCFSAILGASTMLAQVPKSSTLKHIKHFSIPAGVTMDEFIPQTIVLKVKPQYRNQCSANAINNAVFNSVLSSIGGTGLGQVFPHTPAPEMEFNKYGQRMIDLSLTYSFKYTSTLGLVKLINMLEDLNLFEYVEPMPLPKIVGTTNDPYAVNGVTNNHQYNIFTIKAAGAGTSGWDISKGDTNVVIGITDTGTELTHPDLNPNIKRNMGEIPNNGIDDDHDGYIDNYLGWDLGMNDNDPTWQGNAHGVHVCGIADAATNNSVGIGGVAYKCKFLPVKIADATGALTQSYQGITYAADHGVKIINCSWGGTFGGSYGQSVIDYATVNKDVLVVCACGNNGIQQDFFPASFDKVMSVASTDNNDYLSGFSNYSFNVGVCAPGSNIFSTWNGGTYSQLSGTSMASPCAAGVCAMIRAYYPAYNAYQTASRLKQTAYNIYPVGGNASYAGMLGTGRVDMYAALTAASGPWIIDTALQIVDHNDGIWNIGDTLRIGDTYLNTLSPTTNLTATLSCASPYVQIQMPTVTLGVIGTMATKNNYGNPFMAKLIGSPPVNTPVNFKITYSDGTFTASHTFTLTINDDYINIAINDVGTSITSKSLTGFNDNPNQTQGLGFQYLTYGNVLYEGGLMVGTSQNQVSSNVRGNPNPSVSFIDMERVAQRIPSVVSDFDAAGEYTDAGATLPMKIKVLQKDYAWQSLGNRKFVMLQYYIKNMNTDTTTLRNLYAGLFMDYDITAATASTNKDSVDNTNRMGYGYSTVAPKIYAGTKLLSHTAPFVHYGIDNMTGGGGGIDISAGYSDGNKYLTLSTNRSSAGNGTSAGNDICDVTSSGPFTILPGDSIQVAFAVIAGDNLADIQLSALNAQNLYDNPLFAVNEQPIAFASMRTYPNPSSGTSYIDLSSSLELQNADLSIYDLQGRVVATLYNGTLKSGDHRFVFNSANLAPGIYACRFTTEKGVVSKKLVVTK